MLHNILLHLSTSGRITSGSKPIRTSKSRLTSCAISAMPFALCMALAGCSIVDSSPSTTPPELDVRNYYIQLAAPNAKYNYAVTSSEAPFYPASGALTMRMQGPWDSLDNMPLYACLWTYQNYGTPTQWYYGLTDKQAITFGTETSPDNYSDSWVDLQSPLDDTAHWAFKSQSDSITATVVKYGATAQVEGTTYNNVLMVQYTGATTTGTQWFARGIGIIYSHIVRDSSMVQSQLQSVVQ